MKLILLSALILNILSVNAQEKPWQWPIPGQKSGENIIYKPEDFIDKEKNYDNLFISASEGFPVIAPRGGVIIKFGYSFNKTLNSIIGDKHNKPDTDNLQKFDRLQRQRFASKYGCNAKYISLTLGVSCGNGEKYYIKGLRPYKYFKTGEKIYQGDTIGFLGYAYNKIDNPCIIFSRSLNGKSADPMKPFGLHSTFKPYKPVSLKPEIPVSELLDDFKVFRNTLEDAHPGLYDYTTKANMDSTFEMIQRDIDHPMSNKQFKQLLKPVLDSLRDSHSFLYVSPQSGCKPKKSSRDYIDLPISFGIQNDSAVIYKVLPVYQHLLGKTIVKINGDSMDSLIQKIPIKIRSEGFTQGNIELAKLVSYSYTYYKGYYNYEKGDSVTMNFSDGTNARLAYQILTKDDFKEFIPKRKKRAKKYDNLEIEKVDESIVYLRIKSFSMDEVTKDSLRVKMQAICQYGYKNIIIDVRRNSGGNNSYELLFSMLVNQPFKTQYATKVNSDLTYGKLKYSSYYNGVDTMQVFPGYKNIKGKDGSYKINEKFAMPNDSINYDGNVYVLTDKYSYSAATLFPALVHKYKRGLIIGRETGTCYHQMNASKFATIYLQNSRLELKIPLVKVIFDDQIDSTIPWGRGVIPDHIVNLTYDEFFNGTDKILNSALDIIEIDHNY